MAVDEGPMIVAKVSKNWERGSSQEPLILAQLFQRLILHNLARGYRLHSFQVHRLYLPAVEDERDERINETIIAVFERIH